MLTAVPFEESLSPDVNVANEQNRDEDHHFEEDE
jgi:hypothetical protein